MEIKSRAVVLHAIKYGEQQLIVDLLMREAGRVSFICHLSTSGKGKVKAQLFQPLTLVEVVYTPRSTRSLQRFTDVRLALPYASVPFHAVKLSLTLFLAEFLSFATRDEQRNEPLFDYVEKSMMWLDSASDHLANFHLVFMMHLTRFIGFYPNLESNADGAWFDLRAGEFSLTRPTHSDYVGRDEARVITLLMRMRYDTMRLFKMTQAERQRCIELILYYYRLHVPGFHELRSLDVLQTLYKP